MYSHFFHRSLTYLGNGLEELAGQIRQARARVDEGRGVNGHRQGGVPDGGGLDPHSIGIVAALHGHVFHGPRPQPLVGAAEDDEGAVLHCISVVVWWWEYKGREEKSLAGSLLLDGPVPQRTLFPQKVTILGRPVSFAMVSRNDG